MPTRRITRKQLESETDDRLCKAVGLAAAALVIVTGTIIVLILANSKTVTRIWPPDEDSWDDRNSSYVFSAGGYGGPDGFVHGKCFFKPFVGTIPHEQDGWLPGPRATLYPGEDKKEDPDYAPEPDGEPPFPKDDPAIEDEFPDEGDDSESYDNGLAVISVATEVPSEPRFSGWTEADGSYGVVRNVPDPTKARPRDPFQRLAKPIARLSVWNETEQDFIHRDAHVAYDDLESSGFFGPQGDRKPLVILTHGWHGAADDTGFLLTGLRLHSRAVPEAAVVYFDWDKQGAKLSLYNATQAAWRVNATLFFRRLDADTQLHCVGFSLGSFACAALCRQFYNASGKRCARIVAMNPYEVLDTVPQLTQSLRERVYRRDADYVVVLSSTTRNMAPTENQADEYIITNNLAASTEVCDSPDDWSVEVCASDGAKRNSCETFQVQNVSFTIRPTDMKRYCSSMMVPVFFFTALDADNGGVPLIRYNPMASSTIIGTLPTAWDSRIFGKDYRFSTFVRNDSVWYFAHYGHTDRTVSPTRVFVVVVPYVSSAVVSGAAYTAKTRYHNISVYSAFVRGPSNEPAPENVTVVTTGPILSAYVWDAKGYSYFGEMHTSPFRLPISAQHFSRYDCSASGSGYLCAKTDVLSDVPVLRKRIPVGIPEIPIPPGLCSPYVPPDVKLVVWKRKGLNLALGTNVTVTYSHSRQLMAVVLENHEMPKNTTLMSFYDSCGTAGRAGMMFDYDWSKAQMTAAFLMPGRYTLRWYFLFEVLEVPINAFDKYSGLPFPYGTQPTA